jgi:hypothetical protein
VNTFSEFSTKTSCMFHERGEFIDQLVIISFLERTLAHGVGDK